MHHVEQDPLKEAQPIAEAGTHVVEAGQAVRVNAAGGGEQANTESPAAPLAPEEADRFAMAFRPSWEPLAPEAASAPSARPRAPAAPRASSHPPLHHHDVLAQDELLRLRGRRERTRSLGLAAVSVLSFVALVYWGISSTTTGTESADTRALQPPPPAAEAAAVAEPEHTETAPRARWPEPSGLTARLQDPNEPPEAPQAEAEPTDNAAAPGSEATAIAPESTTQELVAARADGSEGTEGTEGMGQQPLAQAPTPATAPPVPEPAADSQTVVPVAVAVAPVAKPAEQAPATVKAAEAPVTKPAPTTVKAAEAPVTKPAPAAAPAPLTAAKAPEPAVARPPLLVVRAVPDGAELWLDGQRMSNPFDTRLPLGSKHKLEAKQDGYETSTQTLRIESDARLTITLRRTTPAPAPHIKAQPLPEGARGAGFVTSNPY